MFDLTKLEKTFLKHQGLAEMKENMHSLILYVEIEIGITFLEMIQKF